MPRFHHPRLEPGQYPRTASAIRSALIERAVAAAARRGATLRGAAAEELNDAAEVAAQLLAVRIESGGRFTAGDAVAVDRALEGVGEAVRRALKAPGGLGDEAALEKALEALLLAPARRACARFGEGDGA